MSDIKTFPHFHSALYCGNARIAAIMEIPTGFPQYLFLLSGLVFLFTGGLVKLLTEAVVFLLDFYTFFYYSVVTFTTLGFGDIVPKCGWLQLWVMIEVIIGYIALGLLITVAASKFARRS